MQRLPGNVRNEGWSNTTERQRLKKSQALSNRRSECAQNGFAFPHFYVCLTL